MGHLRLPWGYQFLEHHRNPSEKAVTSQSWYVSIWPQKDQAWAGETAQWLLALTALAEDRSLVPSTHVRQPTTAWNHSSRGGGPAPFSGLYRHLCICGVYTDNLVHKYIHKS